MEVEGTKEEVIVITYILVRANERQGSRCLLERLLKQVEDEEVILSHSNVDGLAFCERESE